VLRLVLSGRVRPVGTASSTHERVYIQRLPIGPHGIAGTDGVCEEFRVRQIDYEILGGDAFERYLHPGPLIFNGAHFAANVLTVPIAPRLVK